MRVLELRPARPFHFDATVWKPDHFASRDKAWVPGRRWQTMRWENDALGLRLENEGSVDEPCVSLAVWSRRDHDDSFYERLAAEVGYRYNLDLDLDPFYRRFEGDPQLEPILGRWRGMRPGHSASLYEYLVIAIVLQNTTIRRTVQMLDALFERYGRVLRYDDREQCAFWPARELAATSEDELRSLKVGYRARSLYRISATFASGSIDEQVLRGRDEEEQRAALESLYGVGPASVGYMVFDVFHRFGELTHISPWEQKIYSKLLFDRDPDDPLPVESLLAMLAERFGTWSGLAVHYIWEDLFWQRTEGKASWLEPLIRL